jgi:hypothetical protein
MPLTFDISSHASSGPTRITNYLDPRRFHSEGVDFTAPTEPDFHELTDQYGAAPLLGRRKTKGIDDLISATRVASGQAADNASQGYASRLAQQGFNPVAAGVVRAQVQKSGNRPIAELTAQKEQMQYEARKDAASLAATIANQIGSLRESYSRTLADYNARKAQLDQQNNQFNASSALDVGKTNLSASQTDADLAARIALSGGAEGAGTKSAARPVGYPGSDFFPGYIPNSGPIVPGRVGGTTYPGYVFEGETFDRNI